MTSDPEFRSDLYQGNARFYDKFRIDYPEPLLDDLDVEPEGVYREEIDFSYTLAIKA